jgi:hypothetical protein
MKRKTTIVHGLTHDRTIETKRYETGPTELVRIYQDFITAYNITTTFHDESNPAHVLAAAEYHRNPTIHLHTTTK